LPVLITKAQRHGVLNVWLRLRRGLVPFIFALAVKLAINRLYVRCEAQRTDLVYMRGPANSEAKALEGNVPARSAGFVYRRWSVADPPPFQGHRQGRIPDCVRSGPGKSLCRGTGAGKMRLQNRHMPALSRVSKASSAHLWTGLDHPPEE
jgi:hypothetical protein